MNQLFFHGFLLFVSVLALVGVAMAWIPPIVNWWRLTRYRGLPCELPTGPIAHIVKNVPLSKQLLLTAISMDGSNFSCGDVLHWNVENGRLWLRSTTWPVGRYVEGRFFSVTVVPRA